MNILKTVAGSVCLVVLLFTSSVQAKTYSMPAPGEDLVGEVTHTTTKKGDTFIKIAKQFDLSVHELLEANQNIRNPRRLKQGQTLVIPTRFILPKYRTGIVINLAELRLYYFTPDGKHVMTYPVGVGRREWRTPTTKARVVKKKVDPEWNVPKSIKEYTFYKTGEMLPDVVPGGTPDNPLGGYAIYLSEPGILIHGTNAPSSVGRFISSGCIRLHAPDIEELFYQVSKGTPVHIVNHSHKAGWSGGQLYLESHLPVNLRTPKTDLNHDSYQNTIQHELTRPAHVNWEQARQIARQRNGIPAAIGYGTPF